jgi:outer membrane receptor protein involved in Fe transport
VARDRDFQIDIPAGPLNESLSKLSTVSGVSVGFGGTLPAIRTRAVRGRFTSAGALARMLAGTGFVAVRISPDAFRIQGATQVPTPPRVKTSNAEPTPATTSPEEIIVTGQKRTQILSQVPMSVTVVPLADATNRFSPGSRDLALSVEGLALTNLGPGRNRQFIRGVADSPFIGSSQSTVAVQLDNTRATFDAPDPDLRLIDVERVEILKGPQGPLYGSGALGGIYHIVTRKPVMDTLSASARIIGETIAHGSSGIGGEAVLNLPIVTDTLALRAAGYASHGGGWIDNIGRRDNANRSSTYGGRVALRWQPSGQWTIDLGADSQYVTASDDTLSRVSPIAEPADNDFRAATATITGQVGRFDLVSATSYVDHRIDFTLDASASASALGVTAPATYQDNRAYSVLNQELRISPAGSGRITQPGGHRNRRLRGGNAAARPPDQRDGGAAAVQDACRKRSQRAEWRHVRIGRQDGPLTQSCTLVDTETRYYRLRALCPFDQTGGTGSGRVERRPPLRCRHARHRRSGDQAFADGGTGIVQRQHFPHALGRHPVGLFARQWPRLHAQRRARSHPRGGGERRLVAFATHPIVRRDNRAERAIGSKSGGHFDR